MTPQYVSFLIVGSLAGVFNVVARCLLDFPPTYDAAIVVVFVIAFSTAYMLNRRLCCGNRSREHKAVWTTFSRQHRHASG